MYSHGTRRYSRSEFLLSVLIIGTFSSAEILAQTTRTLSSNSEAISSLEFSNSGKYLIAGGSSKTIEVWEVASGEKLKELKGHKDAVWKATISSNERFIVSTAMAKGGLFSVSAAMNIWDFDSSALLHSVSAAPLVYSLTFNEDGSAIAVGTVDKIQLFSVESGAKSAEIKTDKMINYYAAYNKGNLVSLLIPYDKAGKSIVPRSNNFTIKTFNGITGSELTSFATPDFWEMYVKFYEIYEVDISALPPQIEMLLGNKAESVNLFFTLKADNLIEIWDSSEGVKIATLKRGFAIRNVVVENSGRYLATVGDNNLISLWDLASVPGVASRMAAK